MRKKCIRITNQISVFDHANSFVQTVRCSGLLQLNVLLKLLFYTHNLSRFSTSELLNPTGCTTGLHACAVHVLSSVFVHLCQEYVSGVTCDCIRGSCILLVSESRIQMAGVKKLQKALVNIAVTHLNCIIESTALIPHHSFNKGRVTVLLCVFEVDFGYLFIHL